MPSMAMTLLGFTLDSLESTCHARGISTMKGVEVPAGRATLDMLMKNILFKTVQSTPALQTDLTDSIQSKVAESMQLQKEEVSVAFSEDANGISARLELTPVPAMTLDNLVTEAEAGKNVMASDLQVVVQEVLTRHEATSSEAAQVQVEASPQSARACVECGSEDTKDEDSVVASAYGQGVVGILWAMLAHAAVRAL